LRLLFLITWIEEQAMDHFWGFQFTERYGSPTETTEEFIEVQFPRAGRAQTGDVVLKLRKGWSL